MQLKLPVDVHLAVGNDGKMMLLIGGLMKSVKPDELRDVLSEKQLKRAHRQPDVPPKLTKNGKTIGRPRKATKAKKPAKAANAATVDARKVRSAKGLCSWCDNKPAKGKKLCNSHLVGARKAAEAARVAKSRSASKKVAA